jgi:hypothetical protein
VFDRTFDDEVWNQPLRGFSVVQQRELTAADANTLLGALNGGGASTNLSGHVEAGAWHHFESIPVAEGAHLTVTMTGTGDGDLYVAFGARPTESNYACRPYEGGSAELCELTVQAGQTRLFVSVSGYQTADVQIAVTTNGQPASSYVFNSRAHQLIYMKTDVQYIIESSAETDGNLASQIDVYTATDRYEYILELDTQGDVIGGEWVGASKTFHPDFAWLPVRVGGSSVASGKVRYADVKTLLDLSVSDSGGSGGNNGGTFNQSGTVAKNEFQHFGPFAVAAGDTLAVELSGTGDADLYVRSGSAPTTASYDCRPYKEGTNEQCAMTGPARYSKFLNESSCC